MRDDIHKGAHVSAVWRSLVRCSTRDADWKTKGARAAEKAVLSSAAEISKSFVKTVSSVLTDRQLSLSGSRADLEHLRLRSPLSVLESCVVDGLIDDMARGPLSSDAMERCIKNALSENREAQLRAIEVHVETKSPKDSAELMSRMRFLLGKVDLGEPSVNRLREESEKQEANAGFDWTQNIGRQS